jgi:hypothetical protein
MNEWMHRWMDGWMVDAPTNDASGNRNRSIHGSIPIWLKTQECA